MGLIWLDRCGDNTAVLVASLGQSTAKSRRSFNGPRKNERFVAAQDGGPSITP